eukprot:2920359-Rhodomonas_salina.1
MHSVCSYPRSQMQSVMAFAPAGDTVLGAGQAVHTDPPVSFRYVPASHCAHKPGPSTPLNVPTSQAKHDPDPFTLLNEPAVHAEHTAPSGPVYPMLQMQSVMASLRASECAPLGQAEQAAPGQAELKPEHAKNGRMSASASASVPRL